MKILIPFIANGAISKGKSIIPAVIFCLFITSRTIGQPAVSNPEDLNDQISAGWMLKSSDPRAGLEIVKKAQAQAKAQGASEQEATAWKRMAGLYKRLPDFDSSAWAHKEGLRVAKRGNHWGLLGDLYNNYAIILRDTGNFPEALKQLNLGEAAYSRAQDSVGLARIFNTMGITYNRQHKFDSAIVCYQKASEIYMAKDRMLQFLNAGQNIGLALIKMQDTVAAMTQLRYCYRQIKELDDEGLEANEDFILICLNLGNIYRDASRKVILGDTIDVDKTYSDSARLYYDEGLGLLNTISEGVGYAELRALLLKGQGLVAFDQDDYPTAFSILSQSLAIASKLPSNRKLLYDLHHGIGVLHKQRLEWGLARASYDKAYEYLDSNDTLAWAFLLYDMAVVHHHLLEFEKAYELERECFLLYRDIVNRTRISNMVALKEKYLSAQRQLQLQKSQRETREEQGKVRKLWEVLLGLVGLTLLILFFLLWYWQRKRASEKLHAKQEEVYQEKIKNLMQENELTAINAMVEAQEAEKERIATELHDKLGSTLTAMKMHMRGIEEQLKVVKQENSDQYTTVRTILDEVIADVRQIAYDMKSGVVSRFGLAKAVQDLADRLNSSGQLQVEVDVHGLDDRLSNAVELQLFRIIQELVNNVIKHAGAKEVTIQLTRDNGTVNLLVADNGRGFDPSAKETFGMGLENISMRVEKLKGTLHIDSTPGRGTTVTADVPVAKN